MFRSSLLSSNHRVNFRTHAASPKGKCQLLLVRCSRRCLDVRADKRTGQRAGVGRLGRTRVSLKLSSKPQIPLFQASELTHTTVTPELVVLHDPKRNRDIYCLAPSNQDFKDEELFTAVINAVSPEMLLLHRQPATAAQPDALFTRVARATGKPTLWLAPHTPVQQTQRGKQAPAGPVERMRPRNGLDTESLMLWRKRASKHRFSRSLLGDSAVRLRRHIEISFAESAGEIDTVIEMRGDDGDSDMLAIRAHPDMDLGTLQYDFQVFTSGGAVYRILAPLMNDRNHDHIRARLEACYKLGDAVKQPEQPTQPEAPTPTGSTPSPGPSTPTSSASSSTSVRPRATEQRLAGRRVRSADTANVSGASEVNGGGNSGGGGGFGPGAMSLDAADLKGLGLSAEDARSLLNHVENMVELVAELHDLTRTTAQAQQRTAKPASVQILSRASAAQRREEQRQERAARHYRSLCHDTLQALHPLTAPRITAARRQEASDSGQLPPSSATEALLAVLRSDPRRRPGDAVVLLDRDCLALLASEWQQLERRLLHPTLHAEA